jgi:phage minor structural protein
MGGFSTADNILTITETGNPAGYGILRFRLPISGATQFGVSFLVGYQNADHELLYNTGTLTPNQAQIFICDPADNSILFTRNNMEFDRSMLDAPQLSMAIPANDGLQIADLYVILGNNGSLYRDYQSAIITDEYGRFIGTNNYIVDQYCKVIYERGEFHEAEPHLLTEDMPAEIPQLFATGYPDILWRVDGITNNGMIYSPLIPMMQPPTMEIQPPRPMIHVYDSRDKQMSGNGYAILEPISCEVYHEENGTYEATFETYCDKYQKFTYLKKQAQVKIPIHYHGELINEEFRVRQVTRKMDSYGNYRITAIAQQRFYDLSRYLIQDCRPTALKGQAALDWLFSHGWYGSFSIDFTYSSDITKTATAYYQNCNVVSALLGVDQAFVNRWGGRLYRHNKYFSINQEMENCRKSGVIMYSYNMTEIEFEEDDSQLITILKAEDNFGNTYTISNPDVPTQAIPHHIYGYVRFSYDAENIQQFHADAQAYFDEHKQSSVNITVRFANLSDIEKYKQYLDLDSFEVGDRITVYHSDLDIYYSNLEIISKRFDAVAQRTMEIQIGSFKGAITRRTFMSETVSSGDTPADKEIIAINTQLNDMTLRTLRTWGGAGAYKWGEVAKYTWEDVTKYANINN